MLPLQELRSKLEELGLDSTGLKLALVERLEAALSQAAPAAAPAPAVVDDQPKVASPAAGTAAPAPEAEVGPLLALMRLHAADAASSEPALAQAPAAANTTGRQPIQFTASTATGGTELAELEKKKQRAERFGEKLSHADSMRLRALRQGVALCGCCSLRGSMC